MGLLKSVFNVIKKPLDMAIKNAPMIGGTLPKIISVATTVAPIISEIATGYKNNNTISDINSIHDDARSMAVKASMNNQNVDLLSIEGASYLSALTREFSKMANELGLSKYELDEYTALYLLERIKCPPQYIEAILKTLRFNRKVKESGLINDAIETSKIHADNIKNVFNIGRNMYSIDYIIDELEKDMKPKKIITSEGVDLYNKRHDQLEVVVDMTKDVHNIKNLKKVENKIDEIMVNDHQKVADEFMLNHFKQIKENSDVKSDEYIFLYGR